MNTRFAARLTIIVFYITILIFKGNAQNLDSTIVYPIYDTVSPKNDLLEFPMSDVTNMRVTVASKKEEKISEAPSSITAYSSSDIENFGYYTLSDLATITSGYNVTYQYGEAGFVTRGLTAGGFENNKHLLLIDGIPVNFARSYKAQIQEELPLFFAQRVEFLKGPASSLYGVSAFSGVVSVISKDPSSNGTIAESKFSGGTLYGNLRAMGNILHRTNNGISTLSIGFYTKNSSGADIDSMTHHTSNLPFPNRKYWDKNTSIFLKTSHKILDGTLRGTTIGLIYMSREGGLGEMWYDFSTEINKITWKTLVPYIKYQRSLTRKLSINSYLKGNNSIEDGSYAFGPTHYTFAKDSLPQNGASYYKASTINVEALAELRYDINTRTSAIAGINFDRRVEQGNPNSYAYHIDYPDTTGTKVPYDTTFFYPLTHDFKDRSAYFNTFSGYLQIQKIIPLLSGLNITGGFRYDNGKIVPQHYNSQNYTYTRFSPRIAIVQKINSRLNLKLIHSQALRAPSIKEVDLASQFLYEVSTKRGDTTITLPTIKAERIITYEAGLNYSTSIIAVSASIFYNNIHNTIARKYVEIANKKTVIPGTLILNQPAAVKSQGIEIDVVGVISKQLKVFSNYTYIYSLSKDTSGHYGAGVPLSQINGGITYNIPGKHNFRGSLIVKHVNGYLKGLTTKSTTPSFTFIDLNTIFPITENVSIEVQVRNLLNQKVYISTQNSYSNNYLIPLPGRSFLFTLALNFK